MPLKYPASLALAAYISRICFRRPNPPPAAHRRHSKDTLLYFGFVPDAREYGFLITAIFHIWISATYPKTPPAPLCPNPAVLNPMLFKWSRYTSPLVAVIIVAGLVRISAFQHLKEDFTFELAAPEKLVTTGIYAHVQHPSYLPDGILSVANTALFCNLDGWMGTFLPTELVEKLVPLRPFVLTFAAVGWALAISQRVREEEEMLRQKFGKEWEDWHKKTARFIPYVV
jgi:protein-S-isoprenylcysteine O-methyltransferase Ste14